ncbi:MAG: zinc-binding protein [Dehalococcoidia bacterium]|nr:zinc-binding protein [Dehalococcoidia bacterium]
MSDKTLTCRDCGTSFVFTQSEQDFYAGKGFMNEPSRCPDCRNARKASGGGGGGGGGYSGGYARAPREMHKATCSSCGNEAEVPFVPRGDRPVYCSDCFSKQRDAGGGGGGGGSRRY